MRKIVFGATSRTIFNLPVWVTIERGFFREEGLDVSVEIAGNLDLSKQGLREGTTPIATSAPDALMANTSGGDREIMIAGNAERLPHFIITRPHIKTLAQLKGTRFGVAGASDGTTSLMGELAKAGGFQVSDVDIQVVGGAPARWKLLKEGKIDAGMQPFPLSYEAEAAGFNNLGALLDIVPYYQFTAIMAMKAWAESNRPTVVGFLRALARGNAAMAADPDAAALIAAREMQTTPELARRAVGDALRLEILSRDLSVSRDSLACVFRTLQDSGRLDKSAAFEFSGYVDESYLTQSRLPRAA